MKILKVVAPPNFNLFLVGDDHEGTTLRYTKGWNKFLDMANSTWEGIRTNFIWDHGDPIEAIMVDDPRYDFRVTTQEPPLEQMEQAIENRRPIQDKLIGMNEGNHTWKLQKFGLITKKICESLGIEYGTWTTKILWVDKDDKLMLKTYHTHGRKSVTSTADDPKRQKTNKELILKRHLKDMAGDCVLMSKGHIHQIIISRPEPRLFLTDDGSRIRQAYTAPDYVEKHFASPRDVEMSQRREESIFIHPDYRWYVSTGSFLRTMGSGISGYGEMFEYTPTELGFAVAEIRNRKVKDVKPVVL